MAGFPVSPPNAAAGFASRVGRFPGMWNASRAIRVAPLRASVSGIPTSVGGLGCGPGHAAARDALAAGRPVETGPPHSCLTALAEVAEGPIRGRRGVHKSRNRA